ncbi:MAG: FAD-dependent oxidoreductase, partial [Mailhella sp.]|nr:FAD-dependent oxidoreductase [Mailhella sp.]
KPDAVVIATGGLYTLPGIPGEDKSNVASVNSLGKQVKLPLVVFGPELLHKLTKFFLPIGKKVIIIGGKIEGVQGALFLSKRGREVCILEDGPELGKGIPPRYMVRIPSWFDQHGVRYFTEVQFKEITEKGVIYTDKDGGQHLAEGDTVMVLTSQKPDYSLRNAIEGIVDEIHMAGSVNGSEVGSLIVNALENGRSIGCRL